MPQKHRVTVRASHTALSKKGSSLTHSERAQLEIYHRKMDAERLVQAEIRRQGAENERARFLAAQKKAQHVGVPVKIDRTVRRKIRGQINEAAAQRAEWKKIFEKKG